LDSQAIATHQEEAHVKQAHPAAVGGAYIQGHMTTTENIELYWHFVDIV
jgi:heme/copper-type cytochrome/quinol oxidase subunit 3